MWPGGTHWGLGRCRLSARWRGIGIDIFVPSDEETPSSKEATAETTSSEEEQEPGFLSLSGSFGPSGPCGATLMDGRALRRSSRGSFTRGSLEDLLSVDPEAYQSSVWLGTEDGW